MTEHYHFFKVPHETVTEVKFKSMKNSTKVLYMTLCRLANQYANTDGTFFRSMRDLASDAGLTRKTIIEAKKELKKNKYIDVYRGKFLCDNKRSSDCYKINGFRLKL